MTTGYCIALIVSMVFWFVIGRLTARSIRLPNRPKQSCWCWCPSCGTDLCSTMGCSGRVEKDSDVVRYACRCGAMSSWDFGAPVPILIELNGHKPARV